MKLLKLKLIAKKIWLYAKRFWWALVLFLGLLILIFFPSITTIMPQLLGLPY